MKKLCIKGLKERPECGDILQRCLKTVDGYEKVRINLATGEITYSSADCIDEKLLHEALAKEGLELEK